MSLFWAAIAVALVIIWVLTVSDIVRRHLDRKHTAAWLLVVVLVPFAGAVLYWVVRRPTEDELERDVATQNELRERSPFDRTRTR